LKELFNRATVGRSPEETKVVAGLLTKFQATFSKDEWDLGLTNLVEHSINTGDAPPIKQRPRRVPLACADAEKAAIEDLLKKGVIRKSTSPWASPIVLVRKKTGGVRPCIDYRKLNQLLKPDGFPLPRIQDCQDAVAGSALFSRFDMTCGYYQIPVKEDVLQHVLAEHVPLSSVPFFCTLCSVRIRDISNLLDHLRGPCLALSVSSMGPLDINRVIDRSATPYVPDDNDITLIAPENAAWSGQLFTSPLPATSTEAPLSPISAASDSGVAPSPGTPLRDEADNRSLMREMLAVLSEINEGIKQLNEKLNK